MKTIEQFPSADRKYLIQCSLCDEYYDIRDFNNILHHEHALPQNGPPATNAGNQEGNLKDINASFFEAHQRVEYPCDFSQL